MSVKKMLLLASMAVAAVAFAVPAAASASGHFTHNEEPIGEETITTELTGTIGIETASGSYECAVHPVASIGTESGTLQTLGLTKEDCRGTGAFAHCKLKIHELTSGSTLTPTGGENPDIDLKNFKLTKVYETGNPGTEETTSTTVCSIAGLPLELVFENMTLTPDNHAEIRSLSASGNGVLVIEPSTSIAALSTFGDLNVVEGQEGTIGIST